MAAPVITLTAPPYSFLQPSDANNLCGEPETGLCLPVYNPSDLAFQISVSMVFDNSADLVSYLTGQTVTFGGTQYTAFTMAGICTDTILTGNVNPANVYEFSSPATATDWNNLTLSWIDYFSANGNVANWEAMANCTCFSICIYRVTPVVVSGLFGSPQLQWHVTTLGTLSNCFIKAVHLCDTPACNVPSPPASCEVPTRYTSLLQYRNNSDAFGFWYDEAPAALQPGGATPFYNSVRLPFYLHSPVYTEDQMTYQLSDGSSQKLSHRIWKDYKFKTDYWYDDWVQKFVVATAHDEVVISSPYANVVDENFVRIEKIDTEWYRRRRQFY